MTAYLYLLTAVVFETISTSALQAPRSSSTRPRPVLIHARLLPGDYVLFPVTGAARDARWRRLCDLVRAQHHSDRPDRALVWFGQKLDTAALVGPRADHVAGVAVINLFSSTVAH